MMTTKHNEDDDDTPTVPLWAIAFAKSFEFKIPIWGILSLLAALAYWLITVNWQQQQILQSLGELKLSVQAMYSQTSANTGQIAILQFRIDKLEAWETEHARESNNSRKGP